MTRHTGEADAREGGVARHQHASYTDGLRDLAAMDQCSPEIAAVLEDSAQLIDQLASPAAASVEAVAKAIYLAMHGEKGGRWECVEPHYQANVWGNYARAAIAAMPAALTPSPKQMDGDKALGEGCALCGGLNTSCPDGCDLGDTEPANAHRDKALMRDAASARLLVGDLADALEDARNNGFGEEFFRVHVDNLLARTRVYS